MRGSVPAFPALPTSHPRIEPLGALVGPSGRSPGLGCPGLLLGRRPSPVTCSLAPGCGVRSERCGRQRAPLVQESGTRQGRERRLGRGALQVYPVLKENKIFSWENFPFVFFFLLLSPHLSISSGLSSRVSSMSRFPGSPPPWLPWLPLWVQPLGLGLARPCTPSVQP